MAVLRVAIGVIGDVVAVEEDGSASLNAKNCVICGGRKGETRMVLSANTMNHSDSTNRMRTDWDRVRGMVLAK